MEGRRLEKTRKFVHNLFSRNVFGLVLNMRPNVRIRTAPRVRRAGCVSSPGGVIY